MIQTVRDKTVREKTVCEKKVREKKCIPILFIEFPRNIYFAAGACGFGVVTTTLR